MADASDMAPHVYKPTESVQIDGGHEALLVFQTVFIDVYIHAAPEFGKSDFVNLRGGLELEVSFLESAIGKDMGEPSRVSSASVQRMWFAGSYTTALFQLFERFW